jgi:hypothetical protein
MRKRFSKIIMEERIVPLTQMHRCPVICPDAKRLCWQKPAQIAFTHKNLYN